MHEWNEWPCEGVKLTDVASVAFSLLCVFSALQDGLSNIWREARDQFRDLENEDYDDSNYFMGEQLQRDEVVLVFGIVAMLSTAGD